MNNNRNYRGLLVLFILFMGLLAGWFIWSRDTSATTMKVSAVNNRETSSVQSEKTKPIEPVIVDAPKQMPAKASESPPTSSNNDWGVIEFSDGVPVVRTLSTGELCIMVPTVINVGGQSQIRLNMMVEKPGSNVRPSAEIEALRGQAAQNYLNSELSAARRDPTKVIESNSMISAKAGQEVQLSVGTPKDSVQTSFRFTPIVATAAAASP